MWQINVKRILMNKSVGASQSIFCEVLGIALAVRPSLKDVAGSARVSKLAEGRQWGGA